MFKFSKRQLITGIVGIAVCGGLMALFITLDRGGAITEIPPEQVVFRIVSLLLMSGAVGFLGYIFMGKESFLILTLPLALLSVAMVALSLLQQVNDSLPMYLIVGGAVVFSICLNYRQYRATRTELSDKSELSEKERQEAESEEKQMEEFLQEDAIFKKSIGYLTDSIIVATSVKGTLYQVIRCDGFYVFHKTGGQLTGMNESLLVNDFKNFRYNEGDKDDFRIDFKDIEKVSAKITIAQAPFSYGILTFKMSDGKSKRYSFINMIDEKELRTFFGNDIQVKNLSPKDDFKETELQPEDKRTLNKLNNILLIFKVISAFILGVYFVTSSGIAHTVFTVLCIIAIFVPYGLAVTFPRHLSIEDRKRYDPFLKNGKLSLLEPVISLPLIFALRPLLESKDCVLYEFGKFALYSTILLAVLMVVVLVVTKADKRHRSAILVALFAFIIAAPAIVYNVDTVFDYSPTQMVVCTVTGKDTHTNNDGETTYYLSARYADDTIRLTVSKQTFDKCSEGDTITVSAMKGALGIEKVYYFDSTLDSHSALPRLLQKKSPTTSAVGLFIYTI